MKNKQKNKKDKKQNKILFNNQLIIFLAIFVLGLVIFILFDQKSVKFNQNLDFDDEIYKERRIKMIDEQLKSRDIIDQNVINAMEKVPRHEFMPHSRNLAYEDHPVPIGHGQTISQPYIVALMIQELNLKGDEIVLEIGAGSGYNAAVLAEIVNEVYTIEIIEELSIWSKEALERTGYENVYVKHGDGYFGWEGKKFDAIIITAAANHVPQPLINQLKEGGKLILPLNSPAGFQALTLIEKTEQGLKSKVITGVIFVPMTGKMQN